MTDPMNLDKKLSEIRARLDASTPGPWESARKDLRFGPSCFYVLDTNETEVAEIFESKNVELIANAPADLVFLTAALKVACGALAIYADKEQWTIDALENGFNEHGYDRRACEALEQIARLAAKGAE